MEFSDQRELALFYLLFLAAMLAGFFYAQKSRAQVQMAIPKKYARVLAASSETQSIPNTNQNEVPKVDSSVQSLTLVPDLPMPSFDIPFIKENINQFGFGILDFVTGFTSTRIASTDKTTLANANLVTKDNVNVALRYQHLLTPNLRTLFTFEDNHLDFLPPVSGALMNPSINLVSYSVGGQFDFTNSFSATLTIGSEQVPFLKGVSLTQVTIDQLSVPDASLYLSWDMIDRHPFRFGAEGFLKTYLPTSSDTYQSNTNFGFGGRFFIRQSVSANLRFDLGVSAQVLNQNSTIVNQQQTDYGIDLRVTIPIGGAFE